MDALISVFIILFLIGAISFLKPSKKMKALSQIRMLAAKEGFKIGSTNELRKKFKNWNPEVEIYQIKNTSEFKNLHYLRKGNKLELYAPVSFKYEKNFEMIEKKIPQIILLVILRLLTNF